MHQEHKLVKSGVVVMMVMSASHEFVSFDVLQRLSAAADELETKIAGRGAQELISGVIMLSTCNRFEVYVDGVADETPLSQHHHVDHVAGEMRDQLADRLGVTAEQVAEWFQVHHGVHAVEHAFAVTSGLASMVVEECEIIGQVRLAVAKAREVSVLSPGLQGLFDEALRVSKRVCSGTNLGGAGRSIVSVGLDAAGEVLGAGSAVGAESVSVSPALDWAASGSGAAGAAVTALDWAALDVVLIGTGSYAGTSMKQLQDRGVRNVSVFSHSGRGAEFRANHPDVRVLERDELYDAIAAADLVVSCSGAWGRVVQTAQVAAACRQRAERLVLLDLALHGDIDPSIGDLAGVELIDLERIKMMLPADEVAGIDEARTLVREGVEKFQRRERSAELTEMITGLQKHIAETIETQVAAGMPGVVFGGAAGGQGTGLDGAGREGAGRESGESQHNESLAQAEMSRYLRQFANRLLHGPIAGAHEAIANGREREYAAAWRKVLG